MMAQTAHVADIADYSVPSTNIVFHRVSVVHEPTGTPYIAAYIEASSDPATADANMTGRLRLIVEYTVGLVTLPVLLISNPAPIDNLGFTSTTRWYAVDKDTGAMKNASGDPTMSSVSVPADIRIPVRPTATNTLRAVRFIWEAD